MVKTCSKCDEVKELSEFYKRPSAKDGLRNDCIMCSKVRSRQWAINNPGKAVAATNKWNATNPGKAAARSKQWAVDNPEQKSENNRLWYVNNVDKVKDKSIQWALENPDKVVASKGRHYGKRTTGVIQERCALTDALYVMSRILSNTCEPMHVDHIIPLSKGGTHTFDNLQILTAEDNLKKGNRYERFT